MQQGWTYFEIAKKLGCARSTISYHVKGEGITPKNGGVKPSKTDIDLINKLYDSGLSSRQVAKQVPYSRSTVLKYIKNPRPNRNPNQTKKSNSKAVMDWRARQKKKAREYLGGKCKICGYDKVNACLEFHHIDPSSKDWQPFSRGQTRRWQLLEPELDKCVLLCCRCHREVHAGLHPNYLHTI